MVLADEFWFDPADTTTVETMKELLCGNTTSIVVKNKGQPCVFPTPMCFISNKEPFDMEEDPNGENPWPSRLYFYRTKIYEMWNATTKNQVLDGLIKLPGHFVSRLGLTRIHSVKYCANITHSNLSVILYIKFY